MGDFVQMNVFAWICTIFVHSIIGCVIQYPKSINLRYVQYVYRHIIYVRKLQTAKPIHLP